ncbi:SRPBCC domain-containing protein [Exilibacterium tricleocarpae]|uniref:SRPBCC domain-containing protein n=1 Tax=Exilibacterium tricleocarpae TaxID=2591008 RepID=A0A545TLH7_9GAMM|nr:SRPBCC domain-containing protein [Exilibacterium tricleocarpae]TQV78058.1 SRPBCC domain-containing protein [Exilibacterium tricleocarpae]
MSAATKTITPKDPEYTISRIVNAPIARVWRLWTEPDHLRHWFCPKGFTVLEVGIDAQVGGQWMTRMRSSDGGSHTTLGVFREVIEAERLVFTQSWEGSEHHSIITVTLKESGDATEIVFNQAYLESEASRDSHAEGWDEALDNLQRYILP